MVYYEFNAWQVPFDLCGRKKKLITSLGNICTLAIIFPGRSGWKIIKLMLHTLQDMMDHISSVR